MVFWLRVHTEAACNLGYSIDNSQMLTSAAVCCEDRHNKAVRCITRTLSRGAEGGCFMVMDACAANDSPPYSAGTRVPRWLIPSN